MVTLEAIEPIPILALLGVTLVLAYVSSWFFGKTRVPDVIWLMSFGLLTGPILGVFDPSLFLASSALMSAMALMILLFDAGLHMDIFQFMRAVPRSALLGSLNVIVSMGLVGSLSVIFFGFDWIRGLLLGAMVGGTSSTIVVSVTKGLDMNERIRTFLDIESVVTTPITIVVAISLLRLKAYPYALSPSSALGAIFSQFSIALFVGFLSGVIGMFILHRKKGKPFAYMLTLAMILLVYAATESIGGNGPVAALAFGLVLGNTTALSKALRLEKVLTIGKERIERFHDEITFLVRAFFFVFLGLITSINIDFFLSGILIVVALIVSRELTVRISTTGMKISRRNLDYVRVMQPRAESTAVLSQLPHLFGIPGAEVFSNIAFLVILVTVIYTSLSVKIVSTSMGLRNVTRRVRDWVKVRRAGA